VYHSSLFQFAEAFLGIEPLDLQNQILEMQGFGQNLGIWYRRAGAQGDAGKSCDEYDFGAWRNRVAMARELDPLHFRYDYVGEQPVEPLGLEQGRGCGATINGDHFIARSFQRPHEICTHDLFIFSEQNAEHHRSLKIHRQSGRRPEQPE
jgi:hypothetical protein